MTTQSRNVPDLHSVQSDYRIGAHYDAGCAAATAGKVVTWAMPLSEKPFPLYSLTVDGAIENIRFERIGVDYPLISIDPVMGRLLARIDNQKDCWSTDPGIAHVRGILLRDIDVRGQAVERIDIQGNDPEHPIVGVCFENVRINDQPLNADQVTVNTHVQGWTIGSNHGGTAHREETT